LLEWFDAEQTVVVAFLRGTVDLLGDGTQAAALSLQNLIHGAGEPAGEHVVDRAPALAVDVDEGRVIQAHLAGTGVEVDRQDLEQAPAALRQALHVVFEYRNAGQAMAPGLLLAPVPGGLVAGLVENLGVLLGTEHFLDADMVVDEEMPWHIEHRQG